MATKTVVVKGPRKSFVKDYTYKGCAPEIRNQVMNLLIRISFKVVTMLR